MSLGNTGPLTSLASGIAGGFRERQRREELSKTQALQERQVKIQEDTGLRAQNKADFQMLGDIQKQIKLLPPDAANSFIDSVKGSPEISRVLEKFNLNDLDIFKNTDGGINVKFSGKVTDKNIEFLRKTGRQILGFDSDIKVNDDVNFERNPDGSSFEFTDPKAEKGTFKFDDQLGIFNTATGKVLTPFSKLDIKPKDSSAKALTDAQGKALDFSNRILGGLKVMQELVDQGISLKQGKLTLRLFKGESARRLQQAEDVIINAVLRKESGATINKDERKEARLAYLARPGDSLIVIKQKMDTLEGILQSTRKQAGEKQDFEEFKFSFPLQFTSFEEIEEANLPKGTIVFLNGRRARTN